MAALLSMALAGAARADTPSPYYPRTTKSNQDLGAINRDLDDITSRNRNNLVKQQGNVACPSGQVLLGATYKNGYTFGGTCGAPIVSALTSTITVNSGATSTTLNYNAVLRGSWSQVGVATLSGVDTSTFTNLNALYPHRIRIHGYSTGANDYYWLRFNGDAGNNYSWIGDMLCQGGGSFNPNAVASTDRYRIMPGDNAANGGAIAKSTMTAVVEIQATSVSNVVQLGTIWGHWAQNTGTNLITNGCTVQLSGAYVGSASATSLNFHVVTRNGFYGYVLVEAFVPVADPPF